MRRLLAELLEKRPPRRAVVGARVDQDAVHVEDHGFSHMAPALPPFRAGAPSAGAQLPASAEPYAWPAQISDRESREAVERRQQLEGLAGDTSVVARLPARRFLRGHRAPEHDLAVARAHQHVAEPRYLVGGHVGEHRRGRFVVLVLEPCEALGAAGDRPELGPLPLPGRGPALLARVLRARLEQEAHGAARDGHLEVAGLLVAALVEREGDPGVVGSLNRAARVLGHVGESLMAAGESTDMGQEIAAYRLELGADARLDRLHAGLEAVDVEDLEVSRGETGERHAGASSGIRRVRIEGGDRPTGALEIETREGGR